MPSPCLAGNEPGTGRVRLSPAAEAGGRQSILNVTPWGWHRAKQGRHTHTSSPRFSFWAPADCHGQLSGSTSALALWVTSVSQAMATAGTQ